MKESGRDWTVTNGDCVEVIGAMPDESVHLTVTSPPYLSLFVYSDHVADMGNCRTDAEFYEGFGFLIEQLLRVTKPGRQVVIDCMNVPAMKERDGYVGIKDFRGEVIRRFIAAGFIFHSEHCCWKDPLVEATRSKAIGLMHKQLVKDSAMCRAGFAQYLLAFRKPGANPEPVAHEHGLDAFYGERPPTSGNLSHERWRRYASPVWDDIDFSDTLNYRAGRDSADERHICPMALDLVRRALHLWSNPGDLVLDPFTGVGTTGHVALQEGRRFVGSELKSSYFKQAVANLRAAEQAPGDLFGSLNPLPCKSDLPPTE